MQSPRSAAREENSHSRDGEKSPRRNSRIMRVYSRRTKLRHVKAEISAFAPATIGASHSSLSWSRNSARPSRKQNRSCLSLSRRAFLSREASIHSIANLAISDFDWRRQRSRGVVVLARVECRRTRKTRKRRLTADPRPFTALERIPAAKHRSHNRCASRATSGIACIEGDVFLFIARENR